VKKMTEQNVKDALAGESQAHVKYSAFSEQAARENLPNVARAFKANSFAEQIHATNHLRALGGIEKTVENLAAAIAGELFEIEEMYPAYINVAQAQKEKPAETVLNDALAAEKVHAGIYERERRPSARERILIISRSMSARSAALPWKAKLPKSVRSAALQKQNS